MPVRTLAILGALLLVGCGELAEVSSPVSVGNNSLADRLENREIGATEASFSSTPPGVIAFAEALETGQPIPLNIDTGPSGTGLFFGPGRQYSEVTRLAPGADVFATGTQSGEWAMIEVDGVEGWVNIRRLTEVDLPEQELADSVTIQDTVSIYGVPTSASGTNIRSIPQGSGALLVRAPAGAEMIATGNTDRHWVELTYEGVTGWASGNFIVEIGTRTISRTVLLSELNATTTTPPATAAPVQRSTSRTVTTRAPVVRRAPVTAAPTTAAPAPADDDAESNDGGGGRDNNDDAESNNNNGGGRNNNDDAESNNNNGGGRNNNDDAESNNNGGGGNNNNNDSEPANNNNGGGGGGNATETTQAPAEPAPEPAPAEPEPEPAQTDEG